MEPDSGTVALKDVSVGVVRAEDGKVSTSYKQQITTFRANITPCTKDFISIFLLSYKQRYPTTKREIAGSNRYLCLQS